MKSRRKAARCASSRFRPFETAWFRELSSSSWNPSSRLTSSRAHLDIDQSARPTVRSVLKRSLYRGVIEYDKTKKRDLDGSRHRGRQPKKPESELLMVIEPQLRIV